MKSIILKKKHWIPSMKYGKMYENMQKWLKICKNFSKYATTHQNMQKIWKKILIFASFIVFWKFWAICFILNLTYIFMSNMQIYKIPGSNDNIHIKLYNKWI